MHKLSERDQEYWKKAAENLRCECSKGNENLVEGIILVLAGLIQDEDDVQLMARLNFLRKMTGSAWKKNANSLSKEAFMLVCFAEVLGTAITSLVEKGKLGKQLENRLDKSMTTKAVVKQKECESQRFKEKTATVVERKEGNAVKGTLRQRLKSVRETAMEAVERRYEEEKMKKKREQEPPKEDEHLFTSTTATVKDELPEDMECNLVKEELIERQENNEESPQIEQMEEAVASIETRDNEQSCSTFMQRMKERTKRGQEMEKRVIPKKKGKTMEEFIDERKIEDNEEPIRTVRVIVTKTYPFQFGRGEGPSLLNQRLSRLREGMNCSSRMDSIPPSSISNPSTLADALLFLPSQSDGHQMDCQ